MKRVVVATAARKDITEISSWYSRISVSLEKDFARALHEKFTHIAALPETYAIFHGPYRRTKITYFPYLLFYRVKGDNIIVSMVVHEKRNPVEWHKRLH